VSSTVEIRSHIGRTWTPPRAAEPTLLPTPFTVAELTSAHGPLALGARARLLAQPGFVAALRKTAQGTLALHQGNRLLNLIINDRGRYMVGLMAVDLHFNRDAAGVGLTPGRLRRRCAETGTCSPARASAMLTLMRLGDFVGSGPSVQDRRRRELVPTERLINAHRKRWRCQFEASAPLLTEAALALAAVEEPHFVPAMAQLQCAYYDAGLRVLDLAPALRIFGERAGGMFVVLALIGAADDDALVSGAPVAVSSSELARRIGSSRTHVIKLLNDAAADGLVDRSSGNGIVLLPRLSEAVHEFFAIGYLFLAHCAKAIREGQEAAP
jgi:hypothetical protein